MPLLSATARTFYQQARLAVTLSWVAGYVNVTVVAVCGTTVSHVTGNVTTFGLHLAERVGGHGAASNVLFLLHLPLGFFVGAMIAQLLLRIGQTLPGVRPAALPMTAEIVLLAILALAVSAFTRSGNAEGWIWAVTSLGVIVMGVQNATITRISGSVVRTTHLTGVTTDLGIEIVDLVFWLVQHVRGHSATRWRRLATVLTRHPPARRIALLAAIFGSFFVGALLGGVAFVRRPQLSLWPPTIFLILLLVADVWALARRRTTLDRKRRGRRRYNADSR